MDDRGIVIFNKKQIEEFLQRLDEELNTSVQIFIIGGAAATLAYNSKEGTKDIDTWKDELGLHEAYERVKAKFPKLSLPLGPARVHIDSPKMLKRFLSYEGLNTKKLKIKIPDPEDLFLLKAQRADEKDIDDLIELHKNQKLNAKTILMRFMSDVFPLNGGNDQTLVDNYLFCVDQVFQGKVAQSHKVAIEKLEW